MVESLFESPLPNSANLDGGLKAAERVMAQLPDAVLAELAAMDDYDRTLAYDRIGRQHNLSAEQVEAQLKAHQQSGLQSAAPAGEYDPTAGAGEYDPSPQAAYDPTGQAPPADAAPQAASPNYLQDAHRYRVRYDPSQDGQSRQAQIDQAIMCPNCGAPLGIPAIRPIKVTCPNCMTEATFNN